MAVLKGKNQSTEEKIYLFMLFIFIVAGIFPRSCWSEVPDYDVHSVRLGWWYHSGCHHYLPGEASQSTAWKTDELDDCWPAAAVWGIQGSVSLLHMLILSMPVWNAALALRFYVVHPSIQCPPNFVRAITRNVGLLYAVADNTGLASCV